MTSTTFKESGSRIRPGFLHGRGLLTAILVVAFLWSVASLSWTEPLGNSGGLSSVVQFFRAAFTPDVSLSVLKTALEASWTSVAYAVAGISLAVIIGLPLGILASGVLVKSHATRVGTVVVVRFLMGFLRAIHELVWAWLFVVALGLYPAAAILALALPYGGILARIYADILNDVPQEPLQALRSSGASNLQVLIYGRLPMVLPDMLGYTFYRWECAIRAVATMSFVGIAGLGLQIKLSLDDLLYGQVWTFLYFLVFLIVLVDVWSSWVRRSLTS